MKQLSLSKINEVLLKVTNEYTAQQYYKKVAEEKDSNYGQEVYQGGETYKRVIYDIGEKDIFVKVTYAYDSYGNNEYLSQIQFVSPVIKSVTDYEPIN